jgi:hypothetical protein
MQITDRQKIIGLSVMVALSLSIAAVALIANNNTDKKDTDITPTPTPIATLEPTVTPTLAPTNAPTSISTLTPTITSKTSPTPTTKSSSALQTYTFKDMSRIGPDKYSTLKSANLEFKFKPGYEVQLKEDKDYTTISVFKGKPSDTNYNYLQMVLTTSGEGSNFSPAEYKPGKIFTCGSEQCARVEASSTAPFRSFFYTLYKSGGTNGQIALPATYPVNEYIHFDIMLAQDQNAVENFTDWDEMVQSIRVQ